MKSIIKDPEELRFFSENPAITETISQSLKEKWEFHDFSFGLRQPITALTDASSVLLSYTPLTLSDYSLGTRIQSPATNSGTLTIGSGCGGSIFQPYEGPLLQIGTFINGGTLTLTGSASTLMIEVPLGTGAFFTEDQIQQIRDGTLTSIEVDGQTIKVTSASADEKIGQKTDASETSLPISPKPTDVKSDAASLTGSSELANGIDNSQEKTKEDPTFILRFSTSGNNFGGGWRLAPYELSFIQKQASFWDKGYPSDGIETMAVLVAPNKSGLYQKRYAYPDFFPTQTTLNVLTAGGITPETYGLVHADLGGLNLFIEEDGAIGIIDFDDSCYHWFVFDLAIVIFSMAGRFKHATVQPEERKWLGDLVEGYRTIRPLGIGNPMAL